MQAKEGIVMRPITRYRFAVGLAAAAIVVVTGCAQPPTEQLEAAQKAIDSANAAGATEYAKEDFAALEQQFAIAKDELVRQEAARPMFRSYTDVDKMLIKVVGFGGHVAAGAAQNKEVVKIAALALEKEAQEVVASDKELMAKTLTGKERAAVEAIKEDLETLETSLGAVHQSIEKGDYHGAEAQAKALKEKGLAVSGEIQNTIDRVKKEKPASRRYGMSDYHDARRILSDCSACEIGPMAPMRKTVIRAGDHAPLAWRIYAGCHDELA